jgi:eukaryotic-like serine/threonine-protein kinase
MSQADIKYDTVTFGIPATSDSGGLELDLSGRQLGDYRLLRRLGRGAMADVYLAEQGSLRRQVAFKVLRRELAADDSYVRRFDGEAQAAAALVQANIVQIYEVGRVDGWHYIAQEYVEGQNVAQYLQRNGNLDVKLAVAVLRQVTAALCKAADRNIVHRDIKPENIMLAKSGEVKVADFGLARIGAGDEALKLTQVGITMGTPLYMSPEQVEGRPLDPRSDIYSLGVTCYHMLAGKPPFRGDTALSVALQHVRTQPERLENLRPDLPPALSRIIHKMLAKDPAERYQNPRELLLELRALKIEGMDLEWPAELDELSSVEHAALGTASWAATQRLQAVMRSQARKKERRWVYYTAAGVLAAFALGGGLQLLARGPFLLDSAAVARPKMQKENTPAEQYLDASLENTVKAYESVIEYFPDSKLWVGRANQSIAVLYLERGYNDKVALDKAMALFEDFADGSREKEDRAFGLGGEAIVLAFRHEPRESIKKLAELWTFLEKCTPEQRQSFYATQMGQKVQRIAEKNRQAIDKKDLEQFNEALESLSTGEAASSQAEGTEGKK